MEEPNLGVLVMPSWARDYIDAIFIVISADDYYIREAFEKIYKFSVNPPMLHTTVWSASLENHTFLQSVQLLVDSVEVTDGYLTDIEEHSTLYVSDGVIRTTSSYVEDTAPDGQSVSIEPMGLALEFLRL